MATQTPTLSYYSNPLVRNLLPTVLQECTVGQIIHEQPGQYQQCSNDNNFFISPE